MSKSNNTNHKLNAAAKDKRDEYYTQFKDVAEGLEHFSQSFQGKIVYCNCDHYERSSFVRYFNFNFHRLGLKKLVATHYAPRDVYESFAGTYKESLALEQTGEGRRLYELRGDGDFSSPECRELLKQADVVVTNPPFSLFRAYVDMLISYDKDFVVMGSMLAYKNNNMFQRIRKGEMWVKYAGTLRFATPYDDEEKAVDICWYANTGTPVFPAPLKLSLLPFSCNNFDFDPDWNAIIVDRLKDIPGNYAGVMGVPANIIRKYTPEQFELIGHDSPSVNGQKRFQRVFLRNRNPAIPSESPPERTESPVCPA